MLDKIMYYVYLIKSKRSDYIYVGSTNALDRRLEEHNNGRVQSTMHYAPFEIVYYEAYRSERDARIREQKLKYHGQAFRRLKERIQHSMEETMREEE